MYKCESLFIYIFSERVELRKKGLNAYAGVSNGARGILFGLRLLSTFILCVCEKRRLR